MIDGTYDAHDEAVDKQSLIRFPLQADAKQTLRNRRAERDRGPAMGDQILERLVSVQYLRIR